jgi:putative ATP-dependent endonuclease of the OLD family
MKIFKIKIENFRLLKDFSLDLEDELSLVIGKNNTGKTSILSVLRKFLDNEKFSFDDFNNDFKQELKEKIESEEISSEGYKPLGIRLRICIEYDNNDDLSNISRVMMDLEPNNNFIILGFEYVLADHDTYKNLKENYKNFKETKIKEDDSENDSRSVFSFLKQNQAKYFTVIRKSIEFNVTDQSINEAEYIDLDREKISISDIINFKFIAAKRNVTNNETDKGLSGQTSRIYEKAEATPKHEEAIEEFENQLRETDSALSKIYENLFEDIIEKVKNFGGMKNNESEIEIISTLQDRELLKGNTTVVYKHDESNKLPEHHNGLGYMNLISIIFEIEILVHEFKRLKDQKPADINLLFIEEPEAHTHPQMQYIFIKNIKKLLQEGIRNKQGDYRKLQYIISTHSSHIVADSDFDDIEYLKKETSNQVIVKNLKDLEKEYSGNKEYFHFLKQYLTLNKAELFFADKAIFFEGDTERILLPAMMKKIDQESCDDTVPLLSQNISIVEIGAHFKIFEKFISFIGIKSLVITDLDSVRTKEDKNGKEIKSACPVKDGIKTSNTTLKFLFKGTEFQKLKTLAFEKKQFVINDKKKWITDSGGILQIAFQTEEGGYHARSFEDAFFNLNKEFIKNKDNKFTSLKPTYLKRYRENEIDEYKLAEKAVKSKPSLAIEILLNSKSGTESSMKNTDFNNWKIPKYIHEGLEWLKQS